MKKKIGLVFIILLMVLFVIGAQPVGEYSSDVISLDIYSTNAFHG